jgi:hypothetical protein
MQGKAGPHCPKTQHFLGSAPKTTFVVVVVNRSFLYFDLFVFFHCLAVCVFNVFLKCLKLHTLRQLPPHFFIIKS